MNEVCYDHPNYKGILKPRVPCVGCWAIWLARHPEAELKAKDLYPLFHTVANLCRQMSELIEDPF
jgi:hypothetical protein